MAFASLDSQDREKITALLKAIRFAGAKGWTPATSSNFSVKISSGIVLTQSGRDKTEIVIEDLMLVGVDGRVLEPTGAKPSAEAHLHLQLYKSTDAGCVLHTHSVSGLILSMRDSSKNGIKFSGLELLKAFSGIKTHQTIRVLPVVENSQDMTDIWREVAPLVQRPDSMPAFLIRGHGLYVWGEDVFAAKRHMETVEHFLEFERGRS